MPKSLCGSPESHWKTIRENSPNLLISSLQVGPGATLAQAGLRPPCLGPDSLFVVILQPPPPLVGQSGVVKLPQTFSAHRGRCSHCAALHRGFAMTSSSAWLNWPIREPLNSVEKMRPEARVNLKGVFQRSAVTQPAYI